MWAAYDDATYADVLGHIDPGSVVLDIGAGDMRLACRMAERARLVFALELDPSRFAGRPLPANVRALAVDARSWPFPAGVDTTVLLMRHCTHTGLYINKLVAAGCRRLVTNARWGLSVECIDLQKPPQPFATLALGWYACRCGAAGFREGPATELNSQLIEQVHEVATCPKCEPYGRHRNRLT